MSDYQLYLACNPNTRFNKSRIRIALGEETLISRDAIIEKLAARYHELYRRYLMTQRIGCTLYVGIVIGVGVGSFIGSTLTWWWLS